MRGQSEATLQIGMCEAVQELGEKENTPPRMKCTKVCYHNSSVQQIKTPQLHRHADNEEKAKIIDKLENNLKEVLT